MNIPNNRIVHEYSEIFESRGSLYHDAMMSCPTARDAEFSSLFDHVPLKAGECLVDVPSGGGYLKAFLERKMPISTPFVHNFELTSGFGANSTVVNLDSSWPIAVSSADRLVCLAAAHHIQDLSPLYVNVQNVLKSGGFFHLADVAPGSGVQRFLETFVDRYTLGGHRGFYRNFFNEAPPPGFDLVDVSLRDCPWVFESVDQMLNFCDGLFGLQSCSKAELEFALRDCIGVETHARGVTLCWKLVYVDMRLE